MKTAAAVLFALVFAFAAAAQESELNDYPTSVRSEYVFACMAVHGQTVIALQKCSCSIDEIARRLTLDEYLHAKAVKELRLARSGGEIFAMFRGSPWAEKMVAKLKDAQIEADFVCF